MYNLFKRNKPKNITTIIDIGSSKVTCLIAEKKDMDTGFHIIGNSQNICEGFKQGNVTNINKLKPFQYSGNVFTSFSFEKFATTITGIWEITTNIINRVISKPKTSSKDQTFSSVFSP